MTQVSSSSNDTLSLGKRVAEIVAAEGLTQQAFAGQIGISPGFLSSVIRNLKVPGSDFLFSIKQVFGVSIDWLLTGEGTMYGRHGIDIELLQHIVLQYQLWHAAQVEAIPAALTLLKSTQERLQSADVASVKEQEHFLAQCQAVSQLLRGASFLYNSRTYAKEPQQRHAEIQTAVKDYIASQGVSYVASVLGLSETSTNASTNQVHIKIQGNARNFAGVNFNPTTPSPRKKGMKP